MSKYIPGNQKHLTLNDRIYIENELSKGATFKDIAAFLCKDPTTISKEVKSRRLSDWYHKGTFYNAKNFCVHRYHCKKTNACGKIMLCGQMCIRDRCSAVLNVHPVQPATKPVRISKRNGAADLIRRLMYVMAVQ